MDSKTSRRKIFFTATTALWTVLMLTGVLASPHSTQHETEFSAKLFAGATAWLYFIDKSDALSIFTAASMLLGPIWSMIAWRSKQRAAAIGVALGTGVAASLVCTDTGFSLAHMLGALSAPFLLALFVAGVAVHYAKEEVQKTFGVETDSERLRRSLSTSRAG